MKRFVALLFLLLIVSQSQAQTTQKPLILPMQDEASVNTWLLGQAYGNTIGAFNFWQQWYSAGQGLHFGIDLVAPCGTPLIAVADGEVAFVDDFGFGSRPHNLILRHPQIGLTTLYGHLLETPQLAQGQSITQGQFVGFSGDPDGTCDSRPHLHFEVRSLDFRTALNPVDYIDANWHSLALIGSFSSEVFQQDLNNSRRWMSLDDQPDVVFGGMRLNAYNAIWPPAIGERPPTNPPVPREVIPITENTSSNLRRIGYDACCWTHWWHPTDPDSFFTVDGTQGQRALIFEWAAEAGTLETDHGLAPQPLYSPDHSHTMVRIDDSTVQIQRVETGEAWFVETGEQVPAISPDNQRLMWLRGAAITVPGQQVQVPGVEIIISDIRGENAIPFASAPGIAAVWLDNTRLLVTARRANDTTFIVLNVATGDFYELGTWFRPREIRLAPGGNRLMFYLMTQQDSAQNGIYVIDTAEGSQPRKLDWFGSYRWRDDKSLFYIPFDAQSDIHQLLSYDIETGETHALTNPATQPFTIMNGQWQVNADASRIVFRNSLDRNLWFIDLINP